MSSSRKKSITDAQIIKKPAKVEQFDIVFDDALGGVYFAGQEVTGRLVLQLTDEKKVSAILMEFKGRARTYWTKHSGKARQHCSDNEPYFCEQFNTMYTNKYSKQSSQDNKETASNISATKEEYMLPAGTHDIPFSFTLQKSLPSSFEGDFGHIRYTAKATLEMPWDFDIICKRAFTVVGIEDVNEDTKSIDAVKLSDSSFDIRYCCRTQGHVKVTLNLMRTGYAPGEAIILDATVENGSRKTLRYSQATLKQHTTYRAKTFAGQEQTKQTEKMVCRVERGEIGAHSNYAWKEQELCVPAVPPKLARCRIIDVSYALEFEVDPGITVISPIFIGTIPLIKRQSRAVTPVSINRNHHPSTSSSVAATAAILDGGPQVRSASVTESSAVQLRVLDESGNHLLGDSELSYENAVSGSGNNLNDVLQRSIMKRRPKDPAAFLAELYPCLTAPSFEHSLFGAIDISEDKEIVIFGDKHFTPKYPCYRMHHVIIWNPEDD